MKIFIILTLFCYNVAHGEGLKKTEVLDTAVSVEHFDIDEALIDYKEGKVAIKVHLYKDKLSKEAGSRQVESRTYQFDLPAKNTSKLDWFTLLKTHADFSGATDD